MELPRFVALKSTIKDKYLCYVNDDGPFRSFLQVIGEELVTPFTKFEVVKANGGNGLVNMRSCYNNKFWLRASPFLNWIVVAADEPEEDQSKLSCTLFKPVIHHLHGGVTTVSFHHVQLGPTTKPSPAYYDVYTVIDWESMFVLPKYVTLKVDNGRFIKPRKMEGNFYMQFQSVDIRDFNEIIITSDGNIKLQSDILVGDGVWKRYSNNLILAVPGGSVSTIPDDDDTLFWPEKIANNIVALRNLGNDQYCKRYTITGLFSSFLCAIDSSVSEFSRLEVEEPVTSRTINTLEFFLMDGRIYDHIDITVATTNIVNNTNEPLTENVTLSYTNTVSRSWKSSVSSKLYALTTIKAGNPLIVDGQIELPNVEFEGSYLWGETETSTTIVETAYTVTVPPMRKVTVNLIATKASCDIPFSYSQHDILGNEHQVTLEMDDGIYTGINYFYFNYEIKEENSLIKKEKIKEENSKEKIKEENSLIKKENSLIKKEKIKEENL